MKKFVAVALALSLGLLLAFIIGSLRVLAQINTTTTNADTYNLMTAERLDTFSAKGTISSLVFDSGISPPSSSLPTTTNRIQSHNAGNQTNRTISLGTSAITNEEKEEAPYALSGDWSLKVERGKVQDFMAKFAMVRIDGTERHTHEIINFKSSKDSDIQLDPTNITFIKGITDIRTNGIDRWKAVDTFLLINKLRILNIIPNSHKVEDHFKGQPIYGVAESMKDKAGNDIIVSFNNKTPNINGSISNFAPNGREEAKSIANKTGRTANTAINNSSLESLYRKFFGSS
ncbi:MAG TPA: hypothetical protein VE076_08905 [Nitrososphaeraceae archaeon]|nr:hypothetical protein [Nitrososphaeraceae archaeon]